jgi:hypothetical protein
MDLAIPLSADYRLAILRASDQNRLWRSLDERRICMVCTRVFSGQEIRFTTNGDGRYQLHCPAEGCQSAPRDWFFYGSGLRPERAHMTPPQYTEIDFNFG